jgi:pheromone shutdown protein TraB
MREKIRQVQSTQGGSRLQALSTVLLTSVQEDYASELGVELGGEFRAAYQYWQAQQSIPTGTSSQSCALILGDRPLQLTLVRAWESLGFWPKVKVLLGLLWSSWQKPKKEEIQEWLQSVLRDETDVLTESLKELRRHFPTLFTVIIAERDAWLAAKLVQSCRVLSASATAASPVCTVVAIVGAGHIPGIVAWLTTPPADTSITPETVLRDLVTTKRWAHDDAIQLQAIPAWIYEVSHLQPSAS